MTTTTREADISADPKVPLIRITREFDAPPAKVFQAHTDAELVARWTGPDERGCTIDHWDCRTGGSWRYTISGDEGFETGFHGCFHEVRPDEKIVQTFTWEGMPDGVSLETLTLEALDGGRTRLVAESLCDSFEGRDAWLASGMEVGVNEGYAKLDAILTSL